MPAALRALSCLFLLCGQVRAGVLFSESFDGFTGGNFNGGQYQSNLDLAVNGDLPGWTKAGAGAVHAVDHANTNGNISAPRDFAPMLWGGNSPGQANVLTLNTAITNANLVGQRYEISFLASPAAYKAGAQASTAADGVLIEVLRADNSVLASRTHLSGAWVGTVNLQPGGMTYVGDGSGDIRLRLGPLNPGNGHFGSAIDDLQLATGVAVPPPVASNGTAVINEIHYHPLLKTSPSEFVEIYNAGTNALDLGGWRLSGGVDYLFPVGVTLASGATLTIAQDTNEFEVVFGFAPSGQWEQGDKLSNDGEQVTLRDGSDRKIDEVDYGVGFPWPTAANGAGASMELIHPFLDNDLGGSWRASTVPSPGSMNVAFTTNVPPQIRQVRHRPEQPVSGTNVLISAKVTDPDGVASVTLSYQLVDPGSYIRRSDGAYESQTNWVDLAMADDGLNGDAAASDDTWSVALPGALQVHRRLVRYRITMEDSLANSVRVPYPDDEQPNFAYFVYDGVPAWRGANNPEGIGSETNVVTFGTNVMRSLPTYHLLARADDVSDSQYSPTFDEVEFFGTMVYEGTVYDHIRFRNRGEWSTYKTGKNKWKLKFNRARDIEVRDNDGKKYSEKRDILNFEACATPHSIPNRGMAGTGHTVARKLFELAGVPAPSTSYLHLRIIDGVNEDSATNQYDGDLWGLYMHNEQADGRFLEARGLPDGNVYLMQGSGNMKNQGPTQPSDGSDLAAFRAGYNASQTIDWWRSNVDLPVYFSFRAVGREINNHDMREGWNYIMYHHTNGQWLTIPWDLDLLYTAKPHHSGVMNIQNCLSQHAALNIEYKNRGRELQDLLFTPDQLGQVVDEAAAFANPVGQPLTFADVDQLMWNYNPLTQPGFEGAFYQNPSVNSQLRGAGVTRTLVSADHEGMVQWIKDFLLSPSDSGGSTGDNSPGYGYLFLASEVADAQIPDTPTIVYAGSTNYPANDLSFQCSAYSGASAFAAIKWRIGEITDTNSPAYKPNKPRRYEVESLWESAEITDDSITTVTVPNVVEVGHAYRVRCRMKDVTGRWSHWSAPVEFAVGPPDNLIALRDNLRVSEVMYDPPEGSDYEFIELYNTGTYPLDIADVGLSDAVDFSFSDGGVTNLATNAYVVVVRDLAAFSSKYDTNGMVIAGEYTGKLGNGGEELEILGAGAAELSTFEYNDARGWPLAADGAGHSLVSLVTNGQEPGVLDYGGNWRASAFIGGSPGEADPEPIVDVRINEFAAHTDTGLAPPNDSDDWIELHSVANITFNDWYLSDDAGNLKQWQIPAGTVITAGGWVTFYESTGFHSNRIDGFGLDKAGEQIYLSYLPGTDADRVADCLRFEGQENGASLGRYPDGAAFWYAMTLTPTASNQLAAVEPVISEIMYHPAAVGTNAADNTALEYLVIQNGATNEVELWNAAGPWRVSGIGYTLPSNTVIGAGASLTVVAFDPGHAAAVSNFLAAHGLTGTPPNLLGRHNGRLSNTGERLALERPQEPDAEGEGVSWVIVDEAIYSSLAPWPDASANGAALHRIDLRHSGNDPLNWTAARHTPLATSAGTVLVVR